MYKVLQNYIHDESAGLDDGITKVMFIVIAIACGIAMYWFIMHMLKDRSEKSSCSNPENANSPFCVD